MDRAFVGNFKQATSGLVVNVADDLNFTIDAIHLTSRPFTFSTIDRMNFVVQWFQFNGDKLRHIWLGEGAQST